MEFFTAQPLLPTPEDVKLAISLSQRGKDFILKSRKEAASIVERSNPRVAIILGPCSIHDPEMALEYARRIKEEALTHSSFLVMRLFFEKPRTTTGWKGLLYDPYLNGTNDIATGLYWTRKLLKEMAELGVPVATEFVDPLVAPYIEDLITWGFIGARTSSSQPHRQLASSFGFPVGFKNALDGDLLSPIQGIIAARSAHAFMAINDEAKLCAKKSFGNAYSHMVLRGATNGPNYDKKTVAGVTQMMHLHGVNSPILIDCAHGNSQKKYEKQKDVFVSVFEQIEEGNKNIIGVMLESNLEEGNQALSEDPASLRYGVSITDSCIGWSDTQELLCSVDSSSISSSVMRFTHN